MIHRLFRSERARPFLMAGAVALIVLVALAVGAQGVAAQGPIVGTDYELGNFCVNDYQAGSVCTANDVTIAGIVPTIQEACLSANDTATVQFRFEFVGGSQERYDIGLFIGTEGGSAQTGDACYHDFLQESSVNGPWNLTGGYGPFKELEDGNKADQCGDIVQNETNFYYTQVPVTVQCKDTNEDGVVDPFSVCTSWDNNQVGICTTVKNAFPSEKSKCRCDDNVAPDPPVLIYSGYDWGDLPDTYKTLTISNGARHAIQDPDNNYIPNTQGGVAAVWLGSSVDHSPNAELNGLPDATALGDDNNTTDDENGIEMTGEWRPGTDGGQVTVNVSSSDGTCSGCQLGFWIDWNNDGDFDDTGESYLKPVTVGSQIVTFDIPADPPPQITNAYARFRLYSGEDSNLYQSYGLAVNGEVEDYYFAVPTAVDLLSFTATGQRKAIVLKWETASETDNLGFNLYRSEKAAGKDTRINAEKVGGTRIRIDAEKVGGTRIRIDAEKVSGARIKINAALIPSQVYPGSPSGAAYEYKDTTVRRGITYYYWLEDVDIYGTMEMHGPVEAKAK